MKKNFFAGKKIISLILAFILIVTGSSIQSAFADNIDGESYNLLGASGEELDMPDLGSSSPVMPLGISLLSGSTGFMRYNGIDVSVIGDFNGGTVTNYVSTSPLPLAISADFTKDATLGSSPDNIKNRKIIIDINPGMVLHSAAGLKASGFNWVEDRTNLDPTLKDAIESIVYVRNATIEGGVYQYRGGHIEYNIRDGVETVSIPLFVKGEYAALVGSRTAVGVATAIPLDITTPAVASSQATTAADPNAIVIIDHAQIDKVTISPGIFQMYHNNGEPILLEADGPESSSSVINIIPSGISNDYSVVTKNMVFEYSIPPEITITNVEASPYVLSTGVINNFSYSVDDAVPTAKKLILKYDAAFGPVKYTITAKADSTTVVGNPYNLIPNNAACSFDGIFSTGNIVANGFPFLINIAIPFVNLIDFVPRTYQFVVHDKANGMIPLGGFSGSNPYNNNIENQRIRYAFDDTGLDVRVVKLFSEDKTFNNIKITSTDDQVFTLATHTSTDSLASFAAADIFSGDVGIKEVIYEMSKLSVNGKINIAGSGSVLDFYHMTYYGYLNITTGSAAAKITVTTVGDDDFTNATAKTTTTTSQIVTTAASPSSRSYISVIRRTTIPNATHAPGATFTVDSSWQIRSESGINAATNYYVDGFTFYFREIPNTVLQEDSIKISQSGVLINPSTYTYGETTDNTGKRVFTVTVPDAYLSVSVPTVRSSSVMGLKADYKVNNATPSFGVDLFDYIMVISDNVTPTGAPVTFVGSGVTLSRQNTFQVDKKPVFAGNNVLSHVIPVTVSGGASFSANTEARLDDSAWKTYKPSDDNPATNGTLVLNPSGTAQYKLQITNPSESDAVTDFIALIPIPKKDGDVGNSLNAGGLANYKLKPTDYMQADKFGWTINLGGQVSYTPVSPETTNVFTYEYAEGYATDTSSADLLTWYDAVSVPDWPLIKTIRIKSSSIAPKSFDTFEFNIGFDTATAEAQAGNINIYSARFIGKTSSGSLWKVSEPIAILLKTGTVSGQFWTDKSRDGNFDADEGNARCDIFAYETGTTNLLETIKTDLNGQYKFQGLDAGVNVDIVFTNPSTPAALRFETPVTSDSHLTAKVTNITPSHLTGSIDIDSKMIKPFDITYVGNSNGPSNPNSIVANRFAGETLAPLPTAMTKQGYTLMGWATTSGGTTPITDTTVVTGDITYNAIWKQDRFIVAFDGNGAGSPTPASISVTAGKSIAENNGTTYPNTMPTISRAGFVLEGWATNKDLVAPDFTKDTAVTAAKTVYAIWRPIVTFDANGVTTTITPSTITTAIGKSISANTGTHPTALPTPSATGYTFVGWGNLSSDTTATFAATTNISAAKTVYAIWKPIITLDVNGGVAIGTTTIEVDMGGTVSASGVPNTLPTTTKTGYVFAGWATTNTANTSDFTASTTVSGPTEIFAVWNPTVTFKANGGSPSADSVINVKNGTAISANAGATTPTFTFAGKTFIGWGTSSGLLDPDFDDSTTVTGPVAVYALWSTNTKTVTFDSNGGVAANPSTILVDEGYAIEDNDGAPRPNTLPTPTYTGYVLDGWVTDTAATFDKTTVVNSSITVYANWRPIVTFDDNGLIVATISPASITTAKGKSISANTGANPTTLPIPSAAGYIFVGWANAATDTTATFLATTDVSAPRTVYAVWKLTVALDANDSSSTVTPATINAFYKKSIADNGGADPSVLPNPTSVAGYQFDGWANAANDTKSNVLVTDILTASKTIYAVWRPEVSFDLNGVTTTITASTISVESGNNIGSNDGTTHKKTLPTPVAPAGHIFAGWADTPTDTTANFLVTTNVSAPKVVYAVWKQVVTLDVNGGNPLAKTTIEVAPNSAITSNTAPNNILPDATMDGYEFGGWATSKTGTTSNFNDTTNITAPITVYAVWRPIVSFDPNGGDPIASNKIVLEKGKAIIDDPTVTMPVATRSTYKFLGWAASKTATSADFTSTTVVNSSLTVYAIWEEVSHKITVEHYTYNYNQTNSDKLLYKSEVIDAREGTSFTATAMTNENYNFIAGESDSLTITPITQDTTIKLVYKHVTHTITVSGNTGDGNEKIVLNVHNRYPYKNNSVTLQEFLKIADVKTGSDKLPATRSTVKGKDYVVESDDFDKLDYSTFTQGYDQTVTLTFIWDSGQTIDIDVKVRMVDIIPPVITVPDDQRFYFDKGDKVPESGDMVGLAAILTEKGLSVTDNYDKEPSYTLNFVNNGTGWINWKKDGEHAFYVNAVDTSGNQSAQRAVVVIFRDYRDQNYTGGTSVLDGSINTENPKREGETSPGMSGLREGKPILSDYIISLDGTPLGNLPTTGAAVAGISLIPLAGIFLGILAVAKKKKSEGDDQDQQDK